MDRSAFAREVALLTVGKRMPDGVYAHVELLPYLPAVLREAVDAARALARLDGDAFHVVKLGLRGCKLSLLSYPGFFDEPFPALAASWAVDLDAGKVAYRVYAADGNPPILHRKETMLPADHPRLSELAALTAEAERLGLFADSKSIGTRAPWEARLARLGVRFDGHRIVQTRRDEEEAPAAVQRHRTALSRYSLSTPCRRACSGTSRGSGDRMRRRRPRRRSSCSRWARRR